MTSVSNDTPGPSAEHAARDGSVLGRVGFRFLCSYLLLHSFPFPIGYLPFTTGGWYLNGRVALSHWTEKHLLGIATPVPFAFTGSSDTVEAYAAQLNFVLLAIIATVIWTLLDRRRTQFASLREWVRVYVCFHLAIIMFGYGFAKVIPSQFQPLDVERYAQPLGEFSPMGLLWAFMGYSTPYVIFTGLAEVCGAFLLLFRRTATLGALITLGVMSNVAMLNFSYDVPVKLFSLNLLVMCAFIAAPDMMRLANVLVFNRAAPSRPLRALFVGPRVRVAAGIVALLFVARVAWMDVTGNLDSLRAWADRGPTAALYGIYEVEGFQKDGAPLSPLVSDTRQWRRVVFGNRARVTIRSTADAVSVYTAKVDAVQHSLALTARSGTTGTLALNFEQPNADQLILRGRVAGDSIVARLRRVDEKGYLLQSRGFNWIQERPFNR